MKATTNRGAQFKTVIALNIGAKQHLFTGIVRGEITDREIGANGFGYDPVFKPANSTKTFAELTLEEKAIASHRGKAVAQLVAFLTSA